MGYHDRLDATTVLQVTNPDSKDALRTAIAMSRIEAYLRAATVQMRRLWRFERRRLHSEPVYSHAMIQAFVEIHLYFICWATIGRMMGIIKARSRLRAPNTVYKRHRKVIKEYSAARDHLEHYDERLLGGKKTAALPNLSDFGNLHGRFYTFGGYRWDVGPDSLKQLKKIVTELDTGIRKEGLPKAKKGLHID